MIFSWCAAAGTPAARIFLASSKDAFLIAFRGREREKHRSAASYKHLDQGSNPQTRSVPRLGTEPKTFWLWANAPTEPQQPGIAARIFKTCNT